jgi:hypothetical protein
MGDNVSPPSADIRIPSRILLEVPMNPHQGKSAITPELEAEFREALRRAMSAKRDPESMRRPAGRIDRMQEETYRQHGLVAVPCIRELGGELPN